MKRRFLTVLLSLVFALCLAVGLTACGESSSNGGTSGGNQNNEQTDGSEQEGTGGSEQEGTGGSEQEGTGGSEQEGTGGSEQEGTGGSEQEGTGGSEQEGTGGSGDETECNHVAGEAVIENRVEATCAAEGSYDSVVYCSVCKTELSRETVKIDKKEHTKGTAVIENSVEATCAAEGSYDSVVYCSVCKTELSRETVKIDKKEHTKGTAVIENRVEATCTAEGSYDSVVYCTVCDTELSRTTVVVDKKEHTEATPVKENVTEATCTEDGTYDNVVYCAVCDTELSRETVTVEAEGHKWDSGKVTTEATTSSAGVKTYTCTVCGTTKTATIAALSSGGNTLSPSEYAAKMASTLNSDYGLSTRTTANASGWSVASGYYNYLAKTISASSYDYSQTSSLSYTNGTEIGIAIGYNSTATGTFFSTTGSSYVISGSITLPGGYVASAGTIKPVFSAIQSALGIQFVDGYTAMSTSANIDSTNYSSLVYSGAWGTTVDVATSTLSVAVSEAAINNNILNLADYLDYMPNFKKYLEDNPAVYLSILQNGMSTTDGSGAEIYIAPYNDYYDDLLRYCLIRQDWVVELLDDELHQLGDTYALACGATSTSVSGGWMGTAGSYMIETSTEADGGATTFTLVKNYDAALRAVKDTNTALGAAYYAITGAAYTGESGNIVDIMNAAIDTVNGNVTGKQLATLYRAYIDVAYQDENGNSAYATRSDLFNGYSAAWDVDDLVAMLRIVKTNSQNVGLDSCSTVGIFPRDATNDRTPDIIRLAAQLYGERGADSNYEYTYIDSNGDLQDARANASFYQALENFGELASEGLVYDYYNNGTYDYLSSSSLKGDCKTSVGNGFMMYDYPQTQTVQMYDLSSSSPDTDYLFGAINTPVSRWDVDGDGTKEAIMRFTESYKATQTAGLAVAASVANDSNKLAAVLAFIDYLYSNDGQIIAAYGIQDTTENSSNPNGTWYGNYVGSAVNNRYCELVGGQWVVKEEYVSSYFAFNNNLYTGYLYKGKMTPIVTDELYESFLATTGDVYNTWPSVRGSYTSYTRYVLGISLPVGVYNRSLETQLSAYGGEQAVLKVGASLANGTIKHLTNTVDSSNYWYTCVPTALPLKSYQSAALTDITQSALRAFTGTNMLNSKNFFSIFHHIIWCGYSGTYDQQGYMFNFSSITG